jgi:hypothetical protein
MIWTIYFLGKFSLFFILGGLKTYTCTDPEMVPVPVRQIKHVPVPIICTGNLVPWKLHIYISISERIFPFLHDYGDFFDEEIHYRYRYTGNFNVATPVPEKSVAVLITSALILCLQNFLRGQQITGSHLQK